MRPLMVTVLLWSAACADPTRRPGFSGDGGDPGSAPGDSPTVGDTDAGDATPPGDTRNGDTLMCPSEPPFDYTCSPGNAMSCPMGLCVFGQCIAPVVDPDRWEDCSDGTCARCETAEHCPVDCGAPPTFTGAKDYDNATTLTVKVHGWNLERASELDNKIYGEPGGTGGLGDFILQFTPGLPDGEMNPTAPDQQVSVEYFGTNPATYFTPAEIAEIESFSHQNEEALHRYALIVGKFIRHRMSTTGATHVNIYCHSMGCHITRYMIENDIETLTSSNLIVRWVTVAGVVSGARLSRLFDNPGVRDAAALLEMNTNDFIHMNPDFVADNSAVWDHRPREANNPLWQGILVHNIVATDPTTTEGGVPLALLDANNPDDEPNDGIVYSLDEYFHDQDPSVRHLSTGGMPLLPTHSYHHIDHLAIRDHERAGLVMAAALFHRRKVFIELEEVTVLDDLEKDNALDFTNSGDPPSELIVASELRFNPYVNTTFMRDLIAHEQFLGDRSLEVETVTQNVTTPLGYPIYEGPVFDAMTSVDLHIRILEVDRYNRFGILEDLFDPDDPWLDQTVALPLTDGQTMLSNGSIQATIAVRVETLY